MPTELQENVLISVLYGANRYIAFRELNEELESEGQTRRLNPSNAELSGIRVRGIYERKEALFFAAPDLLSAQWKDLILTIEAVQAELLYNRKIMFPLDCVQGNMVKGVVVRDPNLAEYENIDVHFVKPDSPRWDISAKLVQTVKKIHGCGVAMNGFERNQIWVSKKKNEILVFPGYYLTDCKTKRCDGEREGYFLLPRVVRDRNSNELTAEQQDVFSVAVMTFYLLFYTHPFIGGKFWEYSTEDYYPQYSNNPEFIFDDQGGNQLKNLEFDEIIKNQWARTTERLKSMYKQLFAEVCGNGSNCKDTIWDLDEWRKAFKEDAATNDNDSSRPSFPFQTVINYRV